MLPTLIEFGSFRIHSFGFLVAVGFVLGILWCRREAARLGFDVARILDLTFWLLLAGVAGARLLYVIVNLREFARYFLAREDIGGIGAATIAFFIDVVSVWKGGIVWYGGLFAAFGAGVLYMRHHKLPVWRTSDLVAPGVMLGLAVGRLGCLAAGDDYGRVVESAWEAVQNGAAAPWWTLTFTNPDSLVPDEMLGLPLYPTQIMMSLNALAIFGVLVWLRRVKRFDGQVVWTMMALYAVGRAIIEHFRGDAGRGFVFDGLLSTSQLLAAISFAVSAAMLLYLRSRAQRAPAAIAGEKV